MDIVSTRYSSEIFKAFRVRYISGRRVTLDSITNLLNAVKDKFEVRQIGESELSKPIFKVTLGKGPIKILIWTQMHGNESTGTKAVCDLLSYLHGYTAGGFVQAILENSTIQIIPILNPDGAEAYTRVNANNIDLNRDAVDLSAVESQLLRKELEEFNPDFCFNMHDQRTIFGVEGTRNPATISFLAPSEEVTRAITPTRIKTMNVIVAMNKHLQRQIPGHIGRYTDEFYPTATGDNFQKLGFPTILIESGHYKDDYDREKVRKYTFMALFQGIYHITHASSFDEYEDYFTIPNNVKSFYDILHKYPNKKYEIFQYEEKLENDKIVFIPQKVTNVEKKDFFYHKEIVFVK